VHPDNWTVLQVGEWLTSVAEEYNLGGHEVKVILTEGFADVDGRRLSAMTLMDFVDLEPEHGNLLFTIFRKITSAGERPYDI
jgi:hypothetical protein